MINPEDTKWIEAPNWFPSFVIVVEMLSVSDMRSWYSFLTDVTKCKIPIEPPVWFQQLNHVCTRKTWVVELPICWRQMKGRFQARCFSFSVLLGSWLILFSLAPTLPPVARCPSPRTIVSFG